VITVFTKALCPIVVKGTNKIDKTSIKLQSKYLSSMSCCGLKEHKEHCPTGTILFFVQKACVVSHNKSQMSEYRLSIKKSGSCFISHVIAQA
jgi:hypothetical protein